MRRMMSAAGATARMETMIPWLVVHLLEHSLGLMGIMAVDIDLLLGRRGITEPDRYAHIYITMTQGGSVRDDDDEVRSFKPSMKNRLCNKTIRNLCCVFMQIPSQ